MPSGRNLGLLGTNSLTFPRPLAFFADSTRLGPTDAESRGRGGLARRAVFLFCFGESRYPASPSLHQLRPPPQSMTCKGVPK